MMAQKGFQKKGQNHISMTIRFNNRVWNKAQKFFCASFTGKGFFNNDPIVWLDGAIRAIKNWQIWLTVKSASGI
jgi:hypothetical protein